MYQRWREWWGFMPKGCVLGTCSQACGLCDNKLAKSNELAWYYLTRGLGLVIAAALFLAMWVATP